MIGASLRGPFLPPPNCIAKKIGSSILNKVSHLVVNYAQVEKICLLTFAVIVWTHFVVEAEYDLGYAQL